MKIAWLIVLAALLATVSLPSLAQTPQWTVGQHVKVFYPRPGGSGPGWRTGVVTEVFGWGIHMKFDDQDHIETFGNDDVSAVDRGASAAAAKPMPAANAAARQPLPPIPLAAGSCTSDPGIVSGGAGLAATVKHAIYENYAAEINGGLSAPLAVGLTFQSFQIGAPLPNRVGQAGYEFPNALRGTPVYPVTTLHKFCRQYRNATTRTNFAGRYVCFITRFGNGMECGTAAGHRLLSYD